MANLTLTQTWETDVYELATTDPVQGGPGGIANEQAQKLGNRTEWLKSKVDKLLAGDMQLKDAIALTSNTTLDATHMGAFVRLTGTSNLTITLPHFDDATNGLKDGQAIIIKNDTTNVNGSMIVTADTGVILADGEFGQSAIGLNLRSRDTVIIVYRANASNPTLVGTYHAIVIKGDSTPVGTIIMHAANTAPDGYIECDGSVLSRTMYKRLFETIGVTFGAGDGSTTFKIPDMRGYFARGWNNGALVDSGRTFGSTQADELRSHFHTVKKINRQTGTSATGFFAMDDNGTDGSENTETAGGTETRPKNVALLYIIKY
jgi:microcystin-dependent protein